jgi:hypothetical protein
MIRKSVKRFSGKIMLKCKRAGLWAADHDRASPANRRRFSSGANPNDHQRDRYAGGQGPSKDHCECGKKVWFD